MNDTTMPMIILESLVEGSAEDWTGKLRVDALFQLQVSYYNETFSVWEPVIEPVQREPGKWDRWQVNAQIRSHSEDELTEGAGPDARPVPMPKMTIDLAATEILNITVTKSFLRLLTNLGDVSWSLKFSHLNCYFRHSRKLPNKLHRQKYVNCPEIARIWL
jgi:vacuolar protein sorting-associated protein 13A/C